MTKYFFDNEEYDTYDDAWEAASDNFWNNGGFEDFWRNEVDGRGVFEELARLKSPFYFDLLDAMCDRFDENIIEDEDEDEEDEEEED